MAKKATKPSQSTFTPPPIPGKRIKMAMKAIEERWSDYTLTDGTVIRLRPLMIEVQKIEGKYNALGDPIYEIKTGGVMDVNVPKRLKRKT